MMLVPLTQGKFAQVDSADWPEVMKFKWHAVIGKRQTYAARSVGPFRRQTRIYLHQFLMPGRVDHRDGNGLNNQRDNLRPSTKRQNSQGFRSKPKGATSKFRGVSWQTNRAKWHAQIQVNGVVHYLGIFVSEKDAARAYDTAARKHFKAFAAPNFPN